MSIRVKMLLESVIPNTWSGSQAVFRCQYDKTIPEDANFAKATPSGEFRVTIDNPRVLPQLVIGQLYYFDITPAPEPVITLAS